MTLADKVEIANLIESVQDVKKLAKELTSKHHNDKIANYAKAAKANAYEVKKYIIDILQKNPELLFDFDKPIPLSTHSGGDCWWHLRDTQTLTYSFVGDLCVKFKVDRNKIRDFVVETYKARFSTTADALTILDVYAYTSDTKDKNYDICSAWDLVYTNHSTNFDLNDSYEAKVWKDILNYANCTKNKTAYLIMAFKNFLRTNIQNFKIIADKAEKSLRDNSNVGVYEKVGL
jgi:hypothetical protein